MWPNRIYIMTRDYRQGKESYPLHPKLHVKHIHSSTGDDTPYWIANGAIIPPRVKKAFVGHWNNICIMNDDDKWCFFHVSHVQLSPSDPIWKRCSLTMTVVIELSNTCIKDTWSPPEYDRKAIKWIQLDVNTISASRIGMGEHAWPTLHVNGNTCVHFSALSRHGVEVTAQVYIFDKRPKAMIPDNIQYRPGISISHEPLFVLWKKQ